MITERSPNQTLMGSYWDRSSLPGFIRALRKITDKPVKHVTTIKENNNNNKKDECSINNNGNNTSKCLLTINECHGQLTEFSFKTNLIY